MNLSFSFIEFKICEGVIGNMRLSAVPKNTFGYMDNNVE